MSVPLLCMWIKLVTHYETQHLDVPKPHDIVYLAALFKKAGSFGSTAMI